MINTTMGSILSIKCPIATLLEALNRGKFAFCTTSAPKVTKTNNDPSTKKPPATSTLMNDTFLLFLNSVTLDKITVNTTNSPKGNEINEGNIVLTTGFKPSPKTGSILCNSIAPLTIRRMASSMINPSK